MELDVLAVGVNVNIKRTDGRVHSAVVSGVNCDTQFVTVEWYEKGEAKGKENLIGDVKKRSSDKVNLPRPESKLPVSSRNTLRNSVEFDPAKVNVGASIELNNPSKMLLENKPKKSSSKERENPTRISNSYESVNQLGKAAVASSNKNSVQGDWSAGHVSDEEEAVMELERMAHATSKELLDNKQAPQSKIKKPVSKLQPPSQPEAAGSRKSATVREIEKIQLKREERRAAQKNMRDQQPDLEQGNPNFDILQMIQEFQSHLEYTPLSLNDEVEKHQICVCIRKRPMNKKELGRKEIDVVTVPHKDIVIVHEPKVKVDLTKYLENQQFRVDYAFDETADNNLVYKYTARPLVESIFERGMATCFAYGQTGSGKTHTMGGEFSSRSTQNCNNGIYALAANVASSPTMVVGLTLPPCYSP